MQPLCHINLKLVVEWRADKIWTLAAKKEKIPTGSLVSPLFTETLSELGKHCVLTRNTEKKSNNNKQINKQTEMDKYDLSFLLIAPEKLMNISVNICNWRKSF